ncbi:MAG: alanine--tRNA ligase [archaeon]
MNIKTRDELVKVYVDFFVSKGHKEIPPASLVPENDPTVLFTTAGMHPLISYLKGGRHPLGKRLVNVQKCIRTVDIDAVGDEVHHTFFEMLGNWSLGDYWKKEAIEWSFEFLTEVLGLEKERIAVSCFGGDDDAEKDETSAEIWRNLGIPEKRIAFLGKEDNWWEPAGETGPCGPDTEMFYWVGERDAPEEFDVKNKNWVEVGNDVFMEYNKTKNGEYVGLAQKNVDFGGGVERLLAVLNGLKDNYETEMFKGIIGKIEKVSGKKYADDKKEMRIIADHLRAAVFILGDFKGIKPSNLGQGYVLRRLIRRAIRYGKVLGIENDFMKDIAEVVIEEYGGAYGELEKNKDFIYFQLEEEEKKFRETLEKGLKKFENIVNGGGGIISGKNAFLLFQSYGFPIEMTVELAKEKDREVDVEGYEVEAKRHQELSRTSSAGQFKSGLADDSEKTTRLHTANHVLLAVMKKVLVEEEIKQKGSNINPERLRFDFSISRKITSEELKEIEEIVNRKIEAGLEVKREELGLEEAFDSGAQGEFGAKYPDIVSVYTIVDDSEESDYLSKEICTGPHVSNTKEIGKFKILKEQSVSSGVRRIKAVID